MVGKIIAPGKKFSLGRRKFLKTAPALITGAAALAVMPRLAHAFARGGTANPAGATPPPPQPTPAITWGYNNLAFFDHFDSLSTIDVNNTLQPGFNWYTQSLQGVMSFQNGSPTTYFNENPDSFAIADSVLKFNPTNSNPNGNMIWSAGYTGTPSPHFVGKTFTSTGAYFEAKFAFDPTLTSSNFPSWWAWNKEIPLNSANNTPYSGARYTELDFFEYIGGPEFTDWDYTSTTAHIKNNNTNIGLPGGINWNQMHTYGCLWVPQSKNGGTGLIQRYFDGVHYPAGDVSFSSSTVGTNQQGSSVGWLSGIDVSPLGMTIQLGTGPGWPLFIDYVMVWQ